MAAQQIAREAGDGVVALAFADTTQNEVAPFRRRRWQRPIAIGGLADLGEQPIGCRCQRVGTVNRPSVTPTAWMH